MRNTPDEALRSAHGRVYKCLAWAKRQTNNIYNGKHEHKETPGGWPISNCKGLWKNLCSKYPATLEPSSEVAFPDLCALRRHGRWYPARLKAAYSDFRKMLLQGICKNKKQRGKNKNAKSRRKKKKKKNISTSLPGRAAAITPKLPVQKSANISQFAQ
ncbi:hypothetical protein B0H17DRAFT_1138468 [Mycena rosella]|uniref:Uncharacterized protein n=1 Tax=Mycena rosella TaxID=1033263 RepID=A0AAD7D6Z6_MYCRO|nr:hypothetical protein B0H17DRAFT_1138468 [Mycena rosella]